MKLKRKHEPIFFGVAMAAVMSFIMSVVMIIRNVGITPMFFKILLVEWAIGFIAALIPSIFMPPVISKVFNKLVKD